MPEPNETAEHVGTGKLQTEKHRGFCNTPAELIASKFFTLFGRSMADYEFKKKIHEINMSIEIITDIIHEHMAERLKKFKR